MKILTVPHKALYRQAEPVDVFGSKLQTLIDMMFTVMYQAKGIGLAANQVGVLKQVIVINMRYSPFVLINPDIRHIRNGQIWEIESCLSIPNYSTPVERSSEIHVMGRDRNGHKLSFEAGGLLARCIQHETEHLEGKLINEK
jgi:peptide deformylase